MCRYSPSEVLFNAAILDYKEVTAYIKQQLACSVELLDEAAFAPDACMEEMRAQFGDAPEKTAGLAPESPAFTALAVLLGYLKETQKKGVERLKTVHNYAEAQYMQLSPVTRANLELTETMRGREKKGTLLWVLDKTQTAMGKRLMRAWIEQPLVNVAAINARLDGVEELVGDSVARADIAAALSKIFDIERLMTRTVYGSASPREIYALAATCEQLPRLKALARPFGSAEITALLADIDELSDIKELIFAAVDENAPAMLKDGGVIHPGYNTEVDELRDIVHGGKGYLATLEAKLKEETGIRTLKIGYNRVFGYYIEVTPFLFEPGACKLRPQADAGQRGAVHHRGSEGTWRTRSWAQTSVWLVLERQLFDDLLHKISAELPRIQKTASGVARLDVLTALARGGCRRTAIRSRICAMKATS